MAEDDIVVRLRLRDAKRFAADAHRGAEAIESIGDATEGLDKRRGVLGRFSGAMGVLARANRGAAGSFDVLGVSAGSTVGKLVGAQVVLGAMKFATLGLAAALSAPLVASLAGAAAGVGALGLAAGGVLAVGMLWPPGWSCASVTPRTSRGPARTASSRR